MQAQLEKTASVIYPSIARHYSFTGKTLKKINTGISFQDDEKGRNRSMDQNEIKKVIAEQLTKGVSLSDIHKMLFDEYKVRMTFMDLRLMASELESIDWSKSDAAAEVPETPAAEDSEGSQDEEEIFDEDEDLPDDENDADPSEGETPSGEGEKIRGATTVEINKIARPGAVLSGSVNFGSGASSDWVLDQLGRIAMANVKGKPDEQDIKEFQLELQKAVSQAY